MKYIDLKDLTEFENFYKKESTIEVIKDPLGRVNNFQGYIIKNAKEFTWFPTTKRLVLINQYNKEIVFCLRKFDVLINCSLGTNEKFFSIALTESKDCLNNNPTTNKKS